MKKNLLTILAIIAFAFAGCTLDNDDATVIVQNPTTSQNLSGNLTSDLTLQSGIEYTLTGALFVKSGATLTIQAGVTVKALAFRLANRNNYLK
ncbi:MAG: hypothetical protein GKR88_18200 [Flavobacteriaceae bacterium]|nr:MAG: hypothetical protein GKR88_18200 [Flavobacteriaceae bacterium]